MRRTDGVLVALVLAGALTLGLMFACGPVPRPPRPAPPPPAPTPTPAPVVQTWHPTRAQVLDVRMNFGSYQFDDGTPILEWFLPHFTDGQLGQFWARVAGSHDTHVMVSPHLHYRSYEVPGGDLTPAQLHDVIVDLRDHHHLIPFVMLSTGDGGSGTDPDTIWPSYFAALGDVKADAVWCLGWEVGANAGWTSKQILHGVHVLRAWLGPQGVIAFESLPERFTGASHPVEPDDPSGGDEPGWWRLPDAQQIDLFAYETPHGSKLMNPACTSADAPDCWLNRWREGVQRLGVGGVTWPKVRLVLFETNTMDCYNDHGQCSAFGRLTAAGLAVCREYGITCGYGSGAPN